jgi:hypothetical protein
MLYRQQMEAVSLAAQQLIETMGTTTPELVISFPFPEVFDQARNGLSQFLNNL